MELHEILERADAPHELVDWVRDLLADLDQAWDLCDRPDHRIWLAACAGAPIEALIEAAAVAVTRRVEEEVRPPEPILRAVELAVGGGSAPELLEAAEACEAIAAGGMGTYRDAEPPGHAPAARAAALVARAAEGLLAGEARREAARLEQARQTGAFVGVGTQIALPAQVGPARLDVLSAAEDPAQGVFLFAVAAAAEAALDAGTPPTDDPSARESLTRDLDALVRRTLEAEP